MFPKFFELQQPEQTLSSFSSFPSTSPSRRSYRGETLEAYSLADALGRRHCLDPSLLPGRRTRTRLLVLPPVRWESLAGSLRARRPYGLVDLMASLATVSCRRTAGGGHPSLPVRRPRRDVSPPMVCDWLGLKVIASAPVIPGRGTSHCAVFRDIGQLARAYLTTPCYIARTPRPIFSSYSGRACPLDRSQPTTWTGTGLVGGPRLAGVGHVPPSATADWLCRVGPADLVRNRAPLMSKTRRSSIFRPGHRFCDDGSDRVPILSDQVNAILRPFFSRAWTPAGVHLGAPVACSPAIR